MNCNKQNCKNEAEFEVVFLLRMHAKHPPAVSTPLIYVCKDHSDVEWDDVYTDEGWKKIEDSFLNTGYAAPKKEYSCIEIREIKKQQTEAIIPDGITKEELKKNMEKFIGFQCLIMYPHKDAGKKGVIDRISDDIAAVIKLDNGEESLVYSNSELMFLAQPNNKKS